ncbi:MAG: hypothetical protein ACRELY_25525 [Polyangiaceae bacterium]
MSSTNDSLGHVNEAFHDAYVAAEKAAEADEPVFVLFADVLVVHRAGKSIELQVTPARFHALKCAVHAPVAAYTLLRDACGPAMSEAVTKRLETLLDRSAKAIRDSDDAAPLLHMTIHLLENAISGSLSRADLDAFAKRAGEMIMPLMDHSAEIQLGCLHERVDEAFAMLTSEERELVQVVVAGHHQARERSLGMQYFEKRLGKTDDRGSRVIYAEGATSVEAALGVVGKQRIDRDLARAFFGDPNRMERDLLGDAAARLLGNVKNESR